MIGVDLSQAILDEAQKLRPNLYDERIAHDVTEIFRQRRPISLIVAADSFIYFGDLDPLFESMEEGLDTDGYVAFTLENVGTDNEKT
jgi:predicted TPR repeat methyltransferase